MMFEPDKNNEAENERNTTSSNFTGETDRVTGEYHYKNGYTQKIYSDAHYVPQDESTVPPRYYCPPEKQPKAPKKPKNKHKSGVSAIGAFSMCLACALVGGICGASLTAQQLNDKITSLEARLPELEEHVTKKETEEKQNKIITAAPNTANADVGTMTLAEVYDIACEQVVGITTEVTYTNLFGRTSSSAVTGTGFFVTEDGYILTNYHVIEYAYEYGYEIAVFTHDGVRHSAQIVGVEETNDIALLKIDIENASAVDIGDSELLYVGDEVYPVGNPLGELEFSMTFGRVSALNRLIATDENEIPVNMFQFDAAVNSGNSGGPIYNAVGDVVGIVTAKYKSTGVEGIGFAIPINDAIDIANELIQNGYVSGKAKLGLSFDQRFTSVYSRYYGLPQGAYVSDVERNSCAEAAGLQQGDIITHIGSFTISSCTDVVSVVKRYSAGDTVDIVYFRNGESYTVSLVFDEYIPPATKKAMS